MRCIFCLEERDSTIEHVFPEAIGGKMTIDRVCEPCNSWLGTNVDSRLTDHIGVLMKRFLLRIPNRHGKITGLDKILGGGVLANDPEQRVRLVRERGTDRVTPKLIPRSQRIKSDDGNEIIRITIDARPPAISKGSFSERSNARAFRCYRE
jgi:HNH endonuclease